MPETTAADSGTTAPFVRYEATGGHAVLTLDSPHNRNAISPRLIADFADGLDRATQDPRVRAIVLTHTGGTFCAGADLSAAAGAAGGGPEGSRPDDNDRPSPTQAMADLLRSVLETPKPVVGRIDGHVRAGGMGLIGACDIAVAGPASTFALTEARLGLAASIVSLTVLPRITSRAAGRYFLTGEKFGPDEARDIGLVTVAATDTEEVTAALLGELHKASPQGLAESKSLLTRSILADFDARAQQLCDQSARLFATAEAREGMMAFLEKKPPPWVSSP